jgi:hypothetical protein
MWRIPQRVAGVRDNIEYRDRSEFRPVTGIMTDEQSYFYRRAEVELEHAQRAADPLAVRAHYQLAEAYLGRIDAPMKDASESRRT